MEMQAQAWSCPRFKRKKGGKATRTHLNHRLLTLQLPSLIPSPPQVRAFDFARYFKHHFSSLLCSNFIYSRLLPFHVRFAAIALDLLTHLPIITSF